MRSKVFKGLAVLVPLAAAFAAYQQQQHQMSLQVIRARNAAQSLAGKSALVVGGTAGIGRGCAERLAAAGAQVTIVGRNAEAAKEILAGMGDRGSFLQCDASLLRNVKACADKYAAEHEKLDILIVTQGIATIAGRTETAEGIEQKLAMHAYSRMAFAVALQPLLQKAPTPRVLTVLSAGTHGVYPQWETDIDLKTHFSLKNAADAAGLLNDIGVDALSKAPGNERGLYVHAAPGVVATSIGREMPTVVRWLVRGLLMLGRSKEDTAEYMLSPVLDPAAKPGYLLVGQNAQQVSPTPVHEQARDKLWAHTLEVLASAGIKP